MKRLLSILALTIASPAIASPPPPPPVPVMDASNILASPAGFDPARIAPLFAADVKAYRNGKLVADGKPAWLSLRGTQAGHYNGRVIAFSQSSAGYSEDGGDLLVIDTYDTVDRTNLPPHSLADPRMASRSTLYQFGRDGLIHTVRIAEVAGFMQAGKD